jgi:tetratricopeptide (TPR) repeat protein
MNTARAVFWVTALAGLAAAAAFSIRLACADAWFRTETIAGTERALALTPDQEAYNVRLALLVSADDPARATAALKRAVALNPRDAQAWIELGLRYEADRNLPLAELSLRRAADESRTYLPRWTLMNYYFRRNDTAQFWFWAKSAVPMIWGDPLPLFQLCGRVAEDGNLIGRLDIRKPELQSAYLSYLLDVGRPDLAGPASRWLLADNLEADVPLLLAASDRLLAGGRTGDARSIWDGLAAAHRAPGGAPKGTAGTLLNNGDFAQSPSGHGFDWHLPELPGISAALEDRPIGLRLTFSADQPETAEPLFQLVPVEENTAYVLRFRYRTSGIGPASGLSWRVGDPNRNATIAAGDSLSSEEQAEERLAFVTPPGCTLVRVALQYQRLPGTTRISGFIVLRNVELLASAQPPSGGPPPPSRVMK